MFADVTSALISKNNYDFQQVCNLVLSHKSKWFHANQLILIKKI